MGECSASMRVWSRSVFGIIVGTHNTADEDLLGCFTPDMVCQGITVGFGNSEVATSTFTITRERGSGIQEEDTVEEFVLDIGGDIRIFSHGNLEGGSVFKGRHGSDVKEAACEDQSKNPHLAGGTATIQKA